MVSSAESIDLNLFAGAGGLAVGLHQAGFGPLHLYDHDKHACATLKYNIKSNTPTISGKVLEQDLTQYNWSCIDRSVRILAAGVPCQPFSLAGKHYADLDDRNLFPIVLRAIQELQPVAFLLENVRGILRDSCQEYFEYLLRYLEFPALQPHSHELWPDHDKRLKNHRRSASYQPVYRVSWKLLEAADYGVPQMRQRVFIVGTCYDLPIYKFPKQTHSKHALIESQLQGTYWEARDLPKSATPPLNKAPTADLGLDPWVTVRDAISDLPEPSQSQDQSWMNHWHIGGARSYHGHTGSAIDWPSKTIKAGVHGVPGGENTMIDHDGHIRYYTLREAARIQSFPDSHYFEGARLHVTRQIGNAVPSLLAKAVLASLSQLLNPSHSQGEMNAVQRG